MTPKGKRRTEFLADLARRELSISDLALKYHVSESTVKNYRKKLANLPAELAPPSMAVGNGQVRAKLGRVIRDTISGYQGDLEDLEEIQRHLKDWEPDTIKAKIVAIKTKADIRGMVDKAKVIAANLKGPDATRPCGDCINHLNKTPDRLEQLYETMTHHARHEIVGKIVEEVLDLFCPGCRQKVLECLAPSPGPVTGPLPFPPKVEDAGAGKFSPGPAPAPVLEESSQT